MDNSWHSMVDRRVVLQAGFGALFAASPSVLCAGSSASAELLSPAAMRGDLTFLARVFAELHPGLTRYLRPGEFEKRTRQAALWASRARTAPEFFVGLSRLVARVRCGHTYLNPANQPPRALQLVEPRNRLPFGFRWIEGRMVVTRALHASVNLQPGTVIEKIDGTPPGTLLSRLLPLARADGSNDGKRIAQMEVDGGARYALFDIFRPLISTARSDHSLAITIAGKTQLLPAMTESERSEDQLGSVVEPGWRFSINNGIGSLRMPTWVVYKTKWDWASFLDRAIDQLVTEHARGLVVDIRDNEGGLDCGNVLISRLVAHPVRLPRYDAFVRYRRVPDDLSPFLKTWDKGFRDWGDQAKPSSEPGLLRLVQAGDKPDGEIVEPRGRRFSGAVAVLAGPTCSSATFRFCLAVKELRLGRLVGAPTGGNQRGINGGAFFFVQLPESGFEVDLPLIGYFPTRPRPDSGVLPDVLIQQTADDIRHGRDRPMEKAIAMMT